MLALRVNETKLTPTSAFIVNLFALESENNQNMIKESSFGTPRRVLTYLLIFSLGRTPIGVFPNYFSFSHFGHFLLLLEEKTKSTKFCTKFDVQDASFLLSKCTNFLLCSKPVQRNCLHFFKKFKKQYAL